MKQLSVWAKYHPVLSRIIIISRIILLCIAYFLGTQLLKTGIKLSPLLIYFFIGVFLLRELHIHIIEHPTIIQEEK